MKIALITNCWKNSDGGGVKTYIMNLVRKEKFKRFHVQYRIGDDALILILDHNY